MPRVQGTIPSVRKRFQVAPTCDGYEVVDIETGHPLTNSYEFSNEPMQVAADLNDASAQGKWHLALALGAIDNDEFSELEGADVANA